MSVSFNKYQIPVQLIIDFKSILTELQNNPILREKFLNMPKLVYSPYYTSNAFYSTSGSYASAFDNVYDKVIKNAKPDGFVSDCCGSPVLHDYVVNQSDIKTGKCSKCAEDAIFLLEDDIEEFV
jgi:hypothetical protein